MTESTSERHGSLAGRVALVTGARQGIGWHIAHRLAAAGAHVILNARASAPLQAAVARFREQGYGVSELVADVTDPDAVRTEMERLDSNGRMPDILVNNVGARDRRGVTDMTTPEFRALLEADLVSAYDLTRVITSALLGAQHGGAVVNVSSVIGTLGRAGDVAYSAAKAGLDGLTRSLAAELGPHGIRVNSIAPGTIATETNQYLVDDPDMTAWIESRTSLARWGRPEEVAGLAAFLASDDASYITGQTIAVDGGMSTRF